MENFSREPPPPLVVSTEKVSLCKYGSVDSDRLSGVP